LTPVTGCEIDHLHPHSQGGVTDQANGAPLCGRHNRWKQKGYTTWRDPTGTWHTHRPNGTEIT
jgi:5-methylcytosine-specific restriction endonuclease McrA